MKPIDQDSTIRRNYTMLGLLLAVWVLILVALAIFVVPDIYWYSYYSVDYATGFVRRGLAGQLVGLFPHEQYFSALQVLRWLPTASLAFGLALLARAVASGAGHSERRVLLALLTPMLPFGFAYGLYSVRPDLFGATALIVYTVAIQSAGSDRRVVIASAVFGTLTAVLTLMHEAIPFVFGLGVMVSLTVFARARSETALRISALLALGPGMLAAAAIVLLGRRDISGQLCLRIPHGPVNDPLLAHPSFDQVLAGFRFDVDYHDWVCRNILPLFDQNIGDATLFVAHIGAKALLGSTILGVALLALTLQATSHFSGVPFRRMFSLLRARSGWIGIGLGLFLPIFLTGADWTRWWMMITFDIGVSFVLFASGEQEAAQPLKFSMRTICWIGALLVAGLLSAIPGFGIPAPT